MLGANSHMTNFIIYGLAFAKSTSNLDKVSSRFCCRFEQNSNIIAFIWPNVGDIMGYLICGTIEMTERNVKVTMNLDLIKLIVSILRDYNLSIFDCTCASIPWPWKVSESIEYLYSITPDARITDLLGVRRTASSLLGDLPDSDNANDTKIKVYRRNNGVLYSR